MVHCDFHHGNILNTNSEFILSISDLGLCLLYLTMKSYHLDIQ
jgi:hypothetical protein